MASRTSSPQPGGIAQFFKFAERGTNLRTELLAGVTTFFVMAYIIFVNPGILSGGPLEGQGPPFVATLTATCLAAALMSISAWIIACSSDRSVSGDNTSRSGETLPPRWSRPSDVAARR